jgi:hypothetical protein
VNRVNFRIGAIATVAALSALFLSTAVPAGAAKPGKSGVIYACFKAKGKNKGSLRVVASKRGCKKMRGWRPLSWTVNGSGARVGQGQAGAQGHPGPEGKQGQAGAAGQVEQSLLETIENQTTQINALSADVSDLTDEVLSLEGDLGELEGTVGDTCAQLSVLTDQTDEVLESLLGASIGGIVGGVFNVPSPPDPLGAFECT